MEARVRLLKSTLKPLTVNATAIKGLSRHHRAEAVATLPVKLIHGASGTTASQVLRQTQPTVALSALRS